MGHSNGKVTAPVNFADVASVLGTSSQDEGLLCTHSNINMWARYKPINIDSKVPEDSSKTPIQNLEAYQDDINRQKNFGIVIPYIEGSITTLLPALLNGSLEWSYEKPTKDKGFNIGMFHSYNHKAVNPVISIFEDIEVDMDQKGNVTYTFACNNPSSDRNKNANVTVSLLRAGQDWSIKLNDYYLGVIAWNPSNTSMIVYGAETKIGDGSENFTWNANFNDFKSYMGANSKLEWKYLAFLSSTPIRKSEEISTTIIGCNLGTVGKKITIRAYNARVIVYIVDRGLSNGVFTWQAYIRNETSNPVIITGWEIRVFPVDENGIEMIGGAEDYKTGLNISAPVNQYTYIPSVTGTNKTYLDMNEFATGYKCTFTVTISGYGTKPTKTINLAYEK